MPSNRQVDDKDVVYVHNEIVLSAMKNEIVEKWVKWVK